MLLGKHITIVLPAYNAERTLANTLAEVSREVVDRIILVDDCSGDRTAELAEVLGVDQLVVHSKNLGYGGNQKTCYAEALKAETDIIIMLHPDYQYSPRLIPVMAAMIASGEYDLVLGSRIISKSALKGGMPIYKYISNRILTFFENIMLGLKLSEYHTGYRGYSKSLLSSLSFENYSDNFIFDNQLVVQAHALGARIGEISCPSKYFPEASSISFVSSVKYGVGVLVTACQYILFSVGLYEAKFLRRKNV